ncbi:hypothetical protein [Kitasatospora sp. A2-31]|uniref:hypothetical protein n=1 Tax=Kitasatospora sp. A2-31 TaxID=2916414 RepID=UPI001EEAD154|nr:hypothetical protein [Kitasatospora sp. A2-31]MCG6494152.1 hypothetical protein [Kitasatospora sp. A2-31]
MTASDEGEISIRDYLAALKDFPPERYDLAIKLIEATVQRAHERHQEKMAIEARERRHAAQLEAEERRRIAEREAEERLLVARLAAEERLRDSEARAATVRYSAEDRARVVEELRDQRAHRLFSQGLWAGFVLCVLTLGSSVYVGVHGQEALAGVFAGPTLLGMGTLFVLRQQARPKAPRPRLPRGSAGPVQEPPPTGQ